MTEELRVLLEATAGAWRERDAGLRPVPPRSWWDLPPDARVLAFELQAETRDFERAVDPQGFSGTVRAVMARLPE